METSNPFRRRLPVDRPLASEAASGVHDAKEHKSRIYQAAADNMVADEHASTVASLSRTPERVRSKPPPPVVTPRKRSSGREPVTSPPSQSDASGLPLDQFSAGSENKPTGVGAISGTDINSAPNPFLERPKTPEIRRSLDMSELARRSAGSYSGGTAGIKVDGSRHSLDPNAFKELMLTGQHSLSTHPLSGEATGGVGLGVSSGRHEWMSEPVSESGGPSPDDRAHPEASGVVEVSDPAKSSVESVPLLMEAPEPLSRSSSMRVKPPPPKPRTRSGGKSSLSSTSPARISPSNSRPTSILMESAGRLPAPPPPPPPPHTAIATSKAATEPEKKIPPPPPLSRRNTTHRPSPALEPGGSQPTTGLSSPALPIRRSKSAASRGSPGSNASDGISPPPPPPRKARASTYESESLEKLSILPEERGEEPERAAGDILVNLEKLQREVDELRGKYATQSNVRTEESAGC